MIYAFQQGINAVYYADPVRLRKLIASGHFDPLLLEDCGLLSSHFPICRIPPCWETAIGNVSDWNPDCQPLVRDFLKRVSQVKAILRDSFDIPYSPIDYQQYTVDFYAAGPDESIEEALWIDSMEDACRNGARPIDAELYYAGVRFDFACVEELLKQGANPRVPMEDPDDSLMHRIVGEASFLSFETAHAWKSDRLGYRDVKEQEIADLVGLAAHEQMYALLTRYYPEA